MTSKYNRLCVLRLVGPGKGQLVPAGLGCDKKKRTTGVHEGTIFFLYHCAEGIAHLLPEERLVLMKWLVNDSLHS